MLKHILRNYLLAGALIAILAWFCFDIFNKYIIVSALVFIMLTALILGFTLYASLNLICDSLNYMLDTFSNTMERAPTDEFITIEREHNA